MSAAADAQAPRHGGPEARGDWPSVAIIILNWNSWADTLECLESVLRLRYPIFAVFLCDNASTDGSAGRFRQWAEGTLCVLPGRREMAGHVVPPAPKPSGRSELADVEAKGSVLVGDPRVTLIENAGNIGFAAGNNVGVRAALAQGFDHVWLLNADTVVEPDTLSEMVKRMRDVHAAGLCGSLLCYYDAPDVIQEAGGCAYYPLLGLARRLAAHRRLTDRLNWRALEARLGYISGASCLASRAFLEEVGLLSEDYFLYCEEIDWATRGRGRFSLALAERSIVFHKKGQATGSKAFGTPRSPASTYYLWRARRRFTQRYYPAGLVALFGFGAGLSIVHFVGGRSDLARALMAGLRDRAWEAG